MPMFDLQDAAGVMMEINECRQGLSATATSASTPSIPTRGWETVRLSFIVNRPKEEPGFRLERARRRRGPQHPLHDARPYAEPIEARRPKRVRPSTVEQVRSSSRAMARSDAAPRTAPSATIDLRAGLRGVPASAMCSTSSTASWSALRR